MNTTKESSKYNEKQNESRTQSLIESFQDTMGLLFAKPLCRATEKALESSRVYMEEFVSGRKPGKKQADILVEESTTFVAAKRYLKSGKVAVLNFANPLIPGGGVKKGALAQEECLCRSSNLFPCLDANKVFADYYEYHKSLHSHFNSDRLIYTKGVTVFKDDATVPEMMPKKAWFKVDVITCAAPYLAKCKHVNGAVLLELFKSRIHNIFEAACDNKVDVLVLGAFGCGAFKNPPKVVAQAFFEVIEEYQYRYKFKKIIFAIKPSKKEDCPNLQAFRTQFDKVVEGNEAAIDVGGASGNVSPGACNAQSQAVSEPLNISILGDSISTLTGFNPEGYKVYYSLEKAAKTGVRTMQDTWWGKLIEALDGDLLVDNAWSGSRVTKLPNAKGLFPSGCSDERTYGLHIGSVMPDVIIVYLGTNDWAFGAQDFYAAYNTMLKKLKTNYPEAEIWCCTLSPTYMVSKPNFKFPYTYPGVHIEEFNEGIRRATAKHGCNLIDLYALGRPYDSVDGTHPTARGMTELAEMMVLAMTGNRSLPGV